MEEEWLVVKMQMLFLVLGTVSMLSTRKRKLAAASLFDQRKLKRRSSMEPMPIGEKNEEMSHGKNENKSAEKEALLGKSKADVV